MVAFLQKRKQNTKDNVKQSIIVQWAVPVMALFVVVVVLVSNFSVISKNSAKESISKKLINESCVYASNINHTLTAMTYAGQSAAALIGNEDIDSTQWQEYARTLKASIPSPYLIAIVGMDGVGATSASATVNISKEDYFSTTRTQKYVITKDDGILNKDAFISVIPINEERNTIGMIYMYTLMSDMEKLLPTKENDGYPSFALIDGKGNILSNAGLNSYYIEGTNFIDNLRTSTIYDMSFAKVNMRMTKQVKFTFSTEKGSEYKTIVSVPVGIGDWQLITLLNQDYVDLINYNEWTNARNMVISLITTVCVFLGLIIIMSIVNKMKYNEQSKDLADKADTDLLTELNNKIATERKIKEFLEDNPDTQCLMFVFDIDNFKKINDTMGHAFGDEVLRSLGQQLRNEFRVTDIIGRTGGDEFILFLKCIKSDEQLEREGIRISNFFHQFKAGEYVKYSATASIGATVFPRDAVDFQGLYKAADSALYEAKRRGKNQLVFYNKELEKTTSQKRKLVPIENDGSIKR